MKKSLFILFLAFGWCAAAMAQNGLAAKLAAFYQNFPIEKAYLQFDKPYYAAGDTIYFKAYVTKGENHKLSDLSGVLHVDLVNTKNHIDQSIQLRLDTGVAWGDFALPDSLPQGNYRVRAYTQWMRNEADFGFFEKTIPVGALKPVRVPEATVKQEGQNAQPDIQFFPEGGSLVVDLPAKIAVKAVGADGLGIVVRGVITDDTGAQVATFASEHLGMGYFYLTPAEGKTYSAKISYPDGRQQVINLPKPAPEGISLTVDNDSLPKATIKIMASSLYFNNNKGKNYSLVITSGGLITSVTCKLDSPLIKLDILKRKLRTGIATVTLFSPENEPLCERLFFIQNYDHLSLNLSTDKTDYAKREQVNIKLKALNRKGEAATGHFSVSVVDESKAPDIGPDAGNILTNLLLTSDLKGYVEQPGYYFSDTSVSASKNLDVLLLTQGYRRFEWKQVLDTAKRFPTFIPEYGITIAGQVTNLFNKPVVNGTITLLPVKGGSLLSAVTDDKGNYRFANLVFTDTAQFVLSAVNAKNKNSTKIKWVKGVAPPVQPGTFQSWRVIADSILASYVANDKIQQQEMLNYLSGKGIMLKQVNIRERKPDDQYYTQSLAGAGNADQVLHSKDLLGGQLSTSLYLLHGVTPVHRGFSTIPYLRAELMTAGMHKPAPMLVVVDGVIQPNPVDINAIPTSVVETIEVLTSANAGIYGMNSAGGVLIITTKQASGLSANDIAAVGVLPISPTGFYKAREFYAPKYDNPGLQNKQPDLRSTIYWKPELKTDADGNASFEYYNADGAGTCKIIIEGIDKDGNIGRQVFRYRVE